MASSKWLELEMLSREIADTQTRLAAARNGETFDLGTTLELEIVEMEERRRGLLDQIASHVVQEERAPANEESFPTVPSTLSDTEPNESIGSSWRLTPADVDRAIQELERQRTEMLARHAEERESLEAEVVEVDSLEHGIELFIRKFGANSAALHSSS